jgi:carboxyl-terminal processing protease
MAGDEIVRIEGKSTEGMSLGDARDRLAGKLGTQVSFTVRHPHNNQTETVTLTREMVRVSTVIGYRRKNDDSWDYFQDEKNRIGYLRVTGFGRRTGTELRQALESLASQKMRALVLDMRFNPGGLLASAVEVSDLFIASGRIVSTTGRNVPNQEWDAHEAGSFLGFPMAVLVNHASASASEIVAACLQDHKRAVVVGERTWGKGSVQNIIELEGGGSALKLTTAGYRRPSGKNIHRFPGASDSEDWGVRPDEGFNIPMTDAEQTRLFLHLRDREILKRTGEKPDEAKKPEPPFVDTQLQKAVDYLKQQLSGKKEQGKKDGDAAPETSPQQPAGSPPGADP